MPNVIRVTLGETNGLEENPDPKDYSLLSDEDNILIKEHSRGAVESSGTEQIAHNLGYFPHFYAYGEVSSGRYQIMNGYNLFGDFRSFVDTTNLNLVNLTGSSKTMRYFIFYDDIPEE